MVLPLCYNNPMNSITLQPVSFNDALELVLQHANRIKPGTEYVSLGMSVGRILAENIVSDIDMPGADSSSMDGYCLRAEDVKGASKDHPLTLPVTDGIDAGHRVESIPPGSCAYIATGATLPQGADTVIKIEDTAVTDAGHKIKFFSDARPGNYIRPFASELRQGDIMVNALTLITPQVAGQIATAGRSAVQVVKKPVVAVLTSGDEVLMPFDYPLPWQVRNSNSTMLTLQAAEAGATVLDAGIARDRGTHARDLFLRAIESADIVITSGGISMGRRDPFKQVFNELGVTPVFYGVKIKPGKPLMFGFYKDKALFALPGNQVSTSVTFELLVRPFIRKVIGAPVERLTLDLELTEPSMNKEGRDFFKRGRPVYRDGRLMVEPLESQESHMLSSLAGADIIFLHPAAEKSLEAGQKVRCYYLKG